MTGAKETNIRSLAHVAEEILRRAAPKRANDRGWSYCLIRRFADNDMLVLGPYASFTEAATVAGPLDTIKPMFLEEDLV